MAKEKRAKELKDKREQQAKELKEKRDAEKQAIQVRAAAAAAAANAAVGASAVAALRGGASGDPAAASRQPGKQPTRVESSELARMRLVQRTLVYVIGLSPRLAKEELLRRHEFLSLSEGYVVPWHAEPLRAAPFGNGRSDTDVARSERPSQELARTQSVCDPLSGTSDSTAKS